MLCGSGSGGHITPLLAVAKDLKKLKPEAKLVYIGEKNGKYNHILDQTDLFDEKHFIYSGKFRRYHGQSMLVRLTDFKTIALNIRDLIKISLGIVQGLFLLKKLKADRVLLKGGSVSIPVGIGARVAGIFTITHDSDALPGVSNRIGGKYADFHTTAMPAEDYKYPSHKTIQVGLPIDDRFSDKLDSASIKKEFNIAQDSQVLLITGGSGGAVRLNNWCAQILPSLMADNTRLNVFFVTGKGKIPKIEFDNEAKKRLHLIEFSTEMPKLAAISDVIVCRAGATTINEFAAMSKAIIIVPNPDLTGGHQLKNARVYAKSNSAVVLEEKDLIHNIELLKTSTQNLLDDDKLRIKMGANLRSTLPDKPASLSLAEILIKGRQA